MKVAINSLPIKSGHKYRGIGYYTSHLINYLKRDPEIELTEFTNISEVKDADIIHYPWFDLYFHTMPIIKQSPTIVTIHDVIPLLFSKHYPVGLKGQINFILQKLALAGCRYILTDSDVSKKDIVKYLKIDDRKIITIPLAADPKFKVVTKDQELIRVKRKYRLPDRFLLYVGDANWVKNLPFLIEGFRRIQELPEFRDLKMVLVGGVFLKNVENIDHPELKSLKQVNNLIKDYGLEKSILRLGQIETDDLIIFYNLASVYVQPSLYEGFGLPLLQAFACGTPVASSNRGSLPEIGGNSAIYFDPSNIKQFVAIVSDLLENPSLRYKLSKMGVSQASKFSWEKTGAETISVYKKVIQK